MGALALATTGLATTGHRPYVRLEDVVYTVSQVYNNDPGLQPTFANLNDDNSATGVGAANLAETWLMADLGQDKYIGKIKLAGGILPGTWGTTALYLNGSEIQTAQAVSPNTWLSFGVVSGIVDAAGPSQQKDYVIDRTARYIRLYVANNWLSTTEFSIYTR